MATDTPITKGVKARNSSKQPAKADSRLKSTITTGIISSSRPFIFSTTLDSPALMAPVASIMANMPPMMNRKEMISAAFWSPSVRDWNR